MLAFEGDYTQNRVINLSHKHEIQPTFRPLRQTHAQPAHAALAADAGGAGAEGVERDGSDDQGQVQGQVYRPRYVHVHLNRYMRPPQQVRICKPFWRWNKCAAM